MASPRITTLAEVIHGILRSCTEQERTELLSLVTSDKSLDERAKVENALQEAGGNIRIAAEKLGYARRTMQNRMRRLGLPRGFGTDRTRGA